MLQLLKDIPLWLRVWIIFPLSCLNGWLILLLFDAMQPLSKLLITAIILSFLLNFPIQLLQQRGVKRGIAISLVFAVALIFLSVLSFILIPLIIEELSELVTNLPDLINSGALQLQSLQQWAIAQQFPGVSNHLAERAISQLSRLLQVTSAQLLNILLKTINSVINIALLLVLTIFMVIGGNKAWKGIFSWLPESWSQPLESSIQRTFRGYFASQALLSVILSTAQTLVFTVLGVPFAVLYGVSIGIATLVPYAGSFMVVMVSILVALENFRMGLKVLVAAILVGLINDNVIAPRIVGHRIGLNPIWLIIALFLGGKIAGVLGLVIAVPIASVVKQMAEQIRQSSEHLLTPASGEVLATPDNSPPELTV